MACALLIIDVQQGFDDPCWGVRNNPDAEHNIARLLKHFRANAMTVVHVRHDSVSPASPLHPGTDGNRIKAQVRPVAGEMVFGKTVNSAFIGTRLKQFLDANDLSELIIVGLTSDHCVSTTVRMAGNYGYGVQMVADATATFAKRAPDGELIDAQTLHQSSLASLQGEFCRVVNTDEAIRLATPLTRKS